MPVPPFIDGLCYWIGRAPTLQYYARVDWYYRNGSVRKFHVQCNKTPRSDHLDRDGGLTLQRIQKYGTAHVGPTFSPHY